MQRQRIEGRGRDRWPRLAGFAVVAVVLAAASLGCCTMTVNCPAPVTHVMAFGATAQGCPDGYKCVCPVPENLDVTQCDKIWFVNTSEYEVTIKASAGTFRGGDVVVIRAGDAVLVTVSCDAPVGDFELEVVVAEPGMSCPGTARPGIIIRPPIKSPS